MPGMNAVGMNTAESTRAIPITGPEISSIALQRCFLGREALFDVPLHGFHHDNCVIDHESDGQHESKQRQAC